MKGAKIDRRTGASLVIFGLNKTFLVGRFAGAGVTGSGTGPEKGANPMRMFVTGEWTDKPKKIEVRNSYDNSVVDTVPKGEPSDVERALGYAEKGAKVMAKLSGYERWRILRKAADLMAARNAELGQTISKEEGKVIAEGRGEASRAVETMMGSAEEAKRIHGETVPLDGDPTGGKKLGFTLRVPCGVVAAISPFNFPLNLVCHKVGPALAAGNSVIVKPASDTPLSALKLTEILLEAGLPPEGIQCVTGSGGEIGDLLVKDRRVRKVTFTGSREIGERICHMAGIKKVTMELGSNSPLIIMPDADLDKVAAAVAVTGYGNAGQTCISTQRVLAAKKVYSDFLDALKPKVEALTTGNQLDEKSKVGPMVKESEAVRVESWINEAVAGGARLAAGGGRRGAICVPAVVADVKPDMRISRDELFGPAVGVTPFDSIEEAIALANDSVYGLAAGIFTENVEWAMKFAREAEAGNLHVNWGPQWRVDLMPYGGLKDSGFGKEGPRYAVEEMTELKMVVFHLNA
jgi:acyl-CoA reductase-like NAD-dependent aldehyde dehydrogenase